MKYDNLNKDNFWNHVMALYPNATNEFCKWIDSYKESVSWNTLFTVGIKFHDIPIELQCGIWIQYVVDSGACSYEVDWAETELEDEIFNFLMMREADIICLSDET